jgi:hypothetical protein
MAVGSWVRIDHGRRLRRERLRGGEDYRWKSVFFVRKNLLLKTNKLVCASK